MFMLEAGGITLDAAWVERVVDSGFVLEVSLMDGNQLRFTGAQAQRLRTQFNLLLEEFLSWARSTSSPPAVAWTYSWPGTGARAMKSGSTSTS